MQQDGNIPRSARRTLCALLLRCGGTCSIYLQYKSVTIPLVVLDPDLLETHMFSLRRSGYHQDPESM